MNHRHSLLAAALALGAFSAAAVLPEAAPPRNKLPAQTAPKLGNRAPTGTGLAPTTWGFVSHYYGTLYGTGYYPFRVDLTYAGTNSIYGYTFAYPTNGFENDIRAVYLFDVSSLASKPSPIWSAFMFEATPRPGDGTSALSAYANIALQSAGATHSLQGVGLSQGAGDRNVNVYDAEDFETADPFATPELAFPGTNNSLIGSFAFLNNAITTINFDVTAAVNADLGPLLTPDAPVPLNPAWIGSIALLLAGSGLWVMQRRAA